MNQLDVILPYKEYLKTDHWRKLRIKYIYKNASACCWVCKKSPTSLEKSYLVLHHVDYSNLYREYLYRDLFILCNNCHNEVHFILKGTIRLPLTRPVLIIRMRYLRVLVLLKKKEYLRAFFRALTCLIPM